MARASQFAKLNRKPKFEVRHRNRCKVCGRARGYYRKFKCCRCCFRKLASEDDALDYVLGGSFDPHKEALLEAPTRHSFSGFEATTPVAVPPVTEFRYSDSSVEWQVDIDRPGIFVASESSYPGWTATVDGHGAQWFTADYCLRGVELDAGTHRVRFDYTPRLVAWGELVSLVAIAALAGVLLIPRRTA